MCRRAVRARGSATAHECSLLAHPLPISQPRKKARSVMGLGAKLAAVVARVRSQQQALWVFSDQGFVSASNFVFGVLMARLLGVEGFGQWVLLWAVLLYANTICTALILSPLMIELPRAETETERLHILSGSLMAQLLLSGGLALLIALGVWLTGQVFKAWALGSLVWPMAAAMVAYQLQDWARRCFFAQRRARPVLVSDLLAYGGQVLLVAVLGWYGKLNVQSAFLTVAGCYLLGFAVSLAQLRIRPSLRAARSLAAGMWRVSRDYFLAAQFQWIGANGVLFIGASALGLQSAAAIRVAINLLGPTNILLQALENLAPVQCSLRYKMGGHSALLAYLRKLLIAFGGPLAVLMLLISFLGTQLLTLAYGDAYSAFGYLVSLQCAYVFLSFLVRLLTFLRRALDQVQVVSLASLVSALAAVGSVAVLVRPLQDVGVMAGMLAGLSAALLLLWFWPGRHGLRPGP